MVIPQWQEERVCVSVWGVGNGLGGWEGKGGVLRIEHKAPQDTEAVCHRCSAGWRECVWGWGGVEEG